MHKGLIAGAIGIAASVGLGSTECTNGDNAALEYYRAWLFMDSEMHLGLLSDDDEFALSDDAEERLTLGRAGRSHALTLPGWRATWKTIEAVLERLR